MGLQDLYEGSGVELSRCWEPLDSSPIQGDYKSPLSRGGVLSETKNKKCFMNKVMMKLRYDKLFVVDPIGKSGG